MPLTGCGASYLISVLPFPNTLLTVSLNSLYDYIHISSREDIPVSNFYLLIY
jgi:hypothetical protein